ncbi:MAG TPA: phenylacetate--CoA ligase family protein, partial [Candidatus Bathyarchaeia archaeon]|nr:phenylacetate--CoA ligase family protein [Candidatus Bathyarchaeia archaeon]
MNYARAVHYLYLLERRARWPPEKLEDHRNKELRRIITYAYNHVPFYRRKFKEAGLDPEAIKTRHDLKKLPIIRKNDIRQNLKEMISDEFDVNRLRKMSTSGSTGEPLFIHLSPSEVEFRKAKHLRANISLGQKPWDRWVTITGPHHFGKTTRLQRLFGLYVPTTLSVFNDVRAQISALEKLKPAVLDGYSSSLFLLSKEVEKQGIKTIHPRFIIGGAELVDSFSRQYIESVFRVPFYDQYSSVEFERMAWECPKREGYHVDADALILQFLDRNGEEVSPGENG